MGARNVVSRRCESVWMAVRMVANIIDGREQHGNWVARKLLRGAGKGQCQTNKRGGGRSGWKPYRSVEAMLTVVRPVADVIDGRGRRGNSDGGGEEADEVEADAK